MHPPALGNPRRYLIERQLGSGGMGVVYEATDLERSTRVALKAITKSDALNIYRLKNEFRQLADLSHPNLVTLHELCCEDGVWYFTMELVDGASFDAYVAGQRSSSAPPDAHSKRTVPRRPLRETTPTPPVLPVGSEMPLLPVACEIGRLRRVLRQLASAIVALHEADKLHRDLKPSNVLITPDERVVVLDFGLVSNSILVEPKRDVVERTVGGGMFGTPAYMAPEQALSEQVTPASDWYALGAMMFEALTGELPFDGTVIEILRQKVEREAPRPSSRVRGVPEDLDRLCHALLQRDPKQRPSGNDVLRALTGKTEAQPILDAQASSARSRELFVGRASSLAELREAFDAAAAGTPSVVLLKGLSGVGKTALMRRFASTLTDSGEAAVLRGRCYERESVPFKALDSVIDALGRYMVGLPPEQVGALVPRNVHALARLFPVLLRVPAVQNAPLPKHKSSEPLDLRKQAFAALKELLLRITDYQPLVIAIDDLQWGDVDSARLLTQLMSPPDPPPLLMIGAYRSDEAESSPFLRHILEQAEQIAPQVKVKSLPLEALDVADARALCRALLSDLPTTHALAAKAIESESERIPFFITQLVDHLRARAARGELTAPDATLSLEDVVLERIAELPRDAQRLLETLAVAAGPIEQGVALEASGIAPSDRSALLALRAARLARTRGARQTDLAEPYHDRVRKTVLASLDAADARSIHGRIAATIAAWGVGDAERLVVHYAGAGDGVRAGESAAQAADQAAQKLAFDRARELYEQALELRAPSDPARSSLYGRLGEAAANAGHPGRAAEAFLEAAKAREPGEARKLRALAAQQHLRSGRFDLGVALARELLAEVGEPYPDSKLSAVLSLAWERSLLWLEKGRPLPAASSPAPEAFRTLGVVYREIGAFDPLRGAYLRARYLRQALRVGEPGSVLEALTWDAIHTAFADGETRAKETEELITRAERLSDALETPYARAAVAMARSAYGLCAGRLERVPELAELAEHTFARECVGAQWEETFSSSFRYAAIELDGDLGVIAKDAPPRLERARARCDELALESLSLIVPTACLINGEPERVHEHLARERARARGRAGASERWLLEPMVASLLYERRAKLAWEELQAAWPQVESSVLGRSRLGDVRMLFLLGRAALAYATDAETPSSDAARALERAGGAILALGRFDRPDARMFARVLQAGAAMANKQKREALDHLERAVQQGMHGSLKNLAGYAAYMLLHLAPSRASDLAQRAAARLHTMGVRDLRAFSGVYAPGFR